MKPFFAERARRWIASSVVITAIVVVASLLRGDDGGQHWAFLDVATPADLGLVSYGTTSGGWALEDHEPATGGRALKNDEGEPGAEPAVLIAARPRARDLRAKTRCKIVGTAMRADSFAPAPASCGLVFRFVDPKNHWVARAIADVGVEIAAVTNGTERILGRSPPTPAIVQGSWIEIALEARGDVVRVTVDGTPTFVAEAPSIPAAFGAAGLWAPSEATVFFDHFAIETLAPTPQALEILPVLGRRAG